MQMQPINRNGFFFQDVVVNAILLTAATLWCVIVLYSTKTRTIHPSHHDTTKLTNNVNPAIHNKISNERTCVYRQFLLLVVWCVCVCLLLVFLFSEGECWSWSSSHHITQHTIWFFFQMPTHHSVSVHSVDYCGIITNYIGKGGAKNLLLREMYLT